MSWKDIIKNIQEKDLISESKEFIKEFNKFYDDLEVGSNINQFHKDNIKIAMDRVEKDIEKGTNILRIMELRDYTKKVVSSKLYDKVDKLYKRIFGKLFN